MWSSLSDNMLDADVGATPVTKYSPHFPSQTQNTILIPHSSIETISTLMVSGAVVTPSLYFGDL